MNRLPAKLEDPVQANRIDAHGSALRCKDSEIALETDPVGRSDAFNPAELLPAALAACMLKGIERVAPGTLLRSALRRA